MIAHLDPVTLLKGILKQKFSWEIFVKFYQNRYFSGYICVIASKTSYQPEINQVPVLQNNLNQHQSLSWIKRTPMDGCFQNWNKKHIK